MKMTLIGTGTSHGIPVISCNCAVCTSKDEKNKRNRCSAYICHKEISGDNTNLLIDTGPEFRIQALKYNINALNAVFITHSHADHIAGLDDLRIFSHTKSDYCCKHHCTSSNSDESPGSGLAVYANYKTIENIKKRFDYIFKQTQIGGGKPKLNLINSDLFNEQNPIYIGSIRIIPIPMKHGNLTTTGWLFSVKDEHKNFHSFAYLTDCNYIEQSSIDIILNYGGTIENLVIDGLRKNEHSTHFSFEGAIEFASKICAKHTWLTHITHNMSYDEIALYCKECIKRFPSLEKIVNEGGSVLPSYDGLNFNI